MATVTILIGNTDNKLTQQEWSEFCASVENVATAYGPVQFSGYSTGSAPWQNACWVIVTDGLEVGLKTRLSMLARYYRQDSIAVIAGTTEFVEAPDAD